jgi:glycosyltransferase involved in cell wall biosynthesis
MKVLLLLRQSVGGMATTVSDLARELPKHEIEVRIEEASDWIPNETGGKIDKTVTKRLREVSAGYDLVHAFGYRTAWACSEAFGHKEAWVYTGYDIPKTTHRILISHLNDAQQGLCASRAVFRALDEAIAIDLATIIPGVRKPPEDLPSKADCRRAFGLPESGVVIGGLGRLVKERGFDALVAAMGIVWSGSSDAVLAIAGEGPERPFLEAEARQSLRPDQIRFLGKVDDACQFLNGLDLFVVPSRRAGFSMAGLEAMSLGIPTTVRSTGGLIELVDPDISGFVFRADEELPSHIVELLDLPLTLQTVGNAGRIRASETFALESYVESLADVYRSIVIGD